MTRDFFYKQHTQPNLTEQTPEMPLPAFIGPYKVETLLSKGGMSWLYLGIDPDTKKPLAIKTLPIDHLKDKEITERFCEEARIIGLTSHPNIVKLYREGTWEGGLYIAMEWIHGISLRQFLTQQSFSLRRSLEIILQVSLALQHLHAHGVIHRDLKPENILIAENGEIKVIDFGIAQLIQENALKKQQGILGTPNYMSPEQKEDSSKATYASDIYSLGVIAYELILGKLSFGVIDISLLPKHLRKIINKALATSASERYQTIAEFIQDITLYLNSDDIDKEKPEQDGVKEFLEIFQKVSQSLSPFPAPLSESIDIGIAKTKSGSQFGLYYDIFKLPQERYFLVMASPSLQGLNPLFSAASLRGYIKASISQQEDSEFNPLLFLRLLQKYMKRDPFIEEFAVSCLYLDPTLDQLTFFNTGLSELIHVPSGGEARILRSINPLLASETFSEFSETTDNWNKEDLLIFHSLIPEQAAFPEKVTQMELELKQIIQNEILLSVQPQAEAILKSCSTHSLFSFRQTQVVLSIQRTL